MILNNFIQILPWLYLCNEQSISKVIDKVDIWIDFRNELSTNVKVEIPNNIVVIKMPFVDGDLLMAQKIYPIAKNIINNAKNNNQKVLINCHMGLSRSALLALWCMAEVMGYSAAYNKMKLINPDFNPDFHFLPIIEKLKREYK